VCLSRYFPSLQPESQPEPQPEKTSSSSSLDVRVLPSAQPNLYLTPIFELGLLARAITLSLFRNILLTRRPSSSSSVFLSVEGEEEEEVEASGGGVISGAPRASFEAWSEPTGPGEPAEPEVFALSVPLPPVLSVLPCSSPHEDKENLPASTLVSQIVCDENSQISNFPEVENSKIPSRPISPNQIDLEFEEHEPSTKEEEEEAEGRLSSTGGTETGNPKTETSKHKKKDTTKTKCFISKIFICGKLNKQRN